MAGAGPPRVLSGIDRQLHEPLPPLLAAADRYCLVIFFQSSLSEPVKLRRFR